MYIAYGNYAFTAGTVEVAITKRVKRNPRGFRESVMHTWNLRGRLEGANIDAVTAAIAALETAFDRDGRNIGLYEDDGTVTAHYLASNSCLGGTRVVSLDYPDGKGAQYTTFRDFAIVVEGEILVTAGSEASKIWDWQERITLSGGGPRFVFAQPIRGKPVRYTVCERTTFKAQQSGSATGRGIYPPFPPPMFPAHEHTDARVQERSSPQEQQGDYASFGISWSYSFESADPLIGKPGLA